VAVDEAASSPWHSARGRGSAGIAMADGTKQPDFCRKDNSSIVHQAPWGSIVATTLPIEEVALTDLGMRMPPLHSLPAIRVNERKVVCRLTLCTTWGSPASLVGMAVLLEADDQLCHLVLAVVAPRTLVRPWWWRG
jgi:hypothetical protein